jgi:hypothetical protein
MAQSGERSMRGVLGDAETLGELADSRVRDVDVTGRAGVGEEGFERSPSKWAE